jgi:hypothetical protein
MASFSDTFAGTGALDSPWYEETVYGGAWQENSGYANGNANAQEAGAGYGAASDYTGSDMYSQMTYTYTTSVSGGGGGPCFFVPGGGGDGYVVYINDNDVYISRQTNGTSTDLVSDLSATGVVSGMVVKLTCTWTGATNSLKLYLDGVEKLSTTDATYPCTDLVPGMYVYHTNTSDIRINDWAGGDVAAGGTTPKGVFDNPFSGPFGGPI